ncbi:hypothetical protein Dimus_027344 [Dionaea muscipula]
MTVTHLKKKDVVKSKVRGVDLEFDHEKLATILGVPGKNGICEYIKEEVRNEVLNSLGLRFVGLDWEAWWCWLLKIRVGRTEEAKKQRCIAATLTYEVWRERNSRIFSSKSCSTSIVIDRGPFMVNVEPGFEAATSQPGWGSVGDEQRFRLMWCCYLH